MNQHIDQLKSECFRVYFVFRKWAAMGDGHAGLDFDNYLRHHHRAIEKFLLNQLTMEKREDFKIFIPNQLIRATA